MLALGRESRRATHLVLLFDTAIQLSPWQQAFRELDALARSYPHFASIEALWHDLADDETALDIAAQLRPGRHNVLLVFTDGLGRAVHDGRLGRALREVPAGTKVALINPWPADRWRRTGLRRRHPRRGPQVPMASLDPSGLHTVADVFLERRRPKMEVTISTAITARDSKEFTRTTLSWPDRALAFAAASEAETVQIVALAASVPGMVDLDLLCALGARFVGPGFRRHHAAEAASSGFFKRHGGALIIQSEAARQAAQGFLNRAAANDMLVWLVREALDPTTARALGIPLRLLGRIIDGEEVGEVSTELDAAGYAAFLNAFGAPSGHRAPAQLEAPSRSAPAVRAAATLRAGLQHRRPTPSGYLRLAELPDDVVGADARDAFAVLAHTTERSWWNHREVLVGVARFATRADNHVAEAPSAEAAIVTSHGRAFLLDAVTDFVFPAGDRDPDPEGWRLAGDLAQGQWTFGDAATMTVTRAAAIWARSARGLPVPDDWKRWFDREPGELLPPASQPFERRLTALLLEGSGLAPSLISEAAPIRGGSLAASAADTVEKAVAAANAAAPTHNPLFDRDDARSVFPRPQTYRPGWEERLQSLVSARDTPAILLEFDAVRSLDLRSASWSMRCLAQALFETYAIRDTAGDTILEAEAQLATRDDPMGGFYHAVAYISLAECHLALEPNETSVIQARSCLASAREIAERGPLQILDWLDTIGTGLDATALLPTAVRADELAAWMGQLNLAMRDARPQYIPIATRLIVRALGIVSTDVQRHRRSERLRKRVAAAMRSGRALVPDSSITQLRRAAYGVLGELLASARSLDVRGNPERDRTRDTLGRTLTEIEPFLLRNVRSAPRTQIRAELRRVVQLRNQFMHGGLAGASQLLELIAVSWQVRTRLDEAQGP